MTGRELIMHILENNLENEEICKDGRLVGFMTVEEYAVKNEIGTASVNCLIKLGKLPTIKIGDIYFIPKNYRKKLI